MLNQPRRAAVCTSPLSLSSLCICAGWQVLRRDTSAILHVSLEGIPSLCTFRYPRTSPPSSPSPRGLFPGKILASCARRSYARAHVRAQKQWNRCVLSIANTVHGMSKKEKFHDLNHWSGPFDKFIIARLFSGRLVHIYLRKIVRDDVFARYAVKTWIWING